MGLAVAIELFGQVLQVSHWVLDISSFTHTPRLPGGMVLAARRGRPAGLRRRDIG